MGHGSWVAIAVEDTVTTEETCDWSLKGLSEAVAVANVLALGAERKLLTSWIFQKELAPP